MHQDKLENFRSKELDEMTITKMQQALTEGSITSEELVLMYKENISLRDKEINAVLEINPDALQTARALDFERQQKGLRSMLHGIPILIKDNMDTADKMHTSAGSLALKDHYALQDAKVVEKLRQAGAIILGKTNITEWFNFMSDKMTNGYSSRGGQVKNPYGNFDVGGSSSGSAAGVAANLAAAAIGTETSGSIINPAAQNFLVGIKPTVGMISRTGIIPLSHTQDTAGSLARTVEDAVILFSSLIGVDEKDPITLLSEPYQQYNWKIHLKEDGLEGAKLAVPRGLFEDTIPEEQKKLFEQALNKLTECGADIIDDVDIGADQEDLGFAVLLHEFKVNVNEYLGKSNPQNPIRSLEDLVSYNNRHSKAMLRFGQNLLEQSEKTSGMLTEREYVEALERNRFLSASQGISETLKKIGADAIVLPQDYGCNIGAAAGFPSITVPYGFSEQNEPFGVTFTGYAFSEPKLIEYAYAFEQATKARRKP